MCAIELYILIDSFATTEIYLLRVGNTFTCNVEAEFHEIEIESINVTRKAEGSRRMHYYNGKFFLIVRFAWIAWNSNLPMP